MPYNRKKTSNHHSAFIKLGLVLGFCVAGAGFAQAGLKPPAIKTPPAQTSSLSIPVQSSVAEAQDWAQRLQDVDTQAQLDAVTEQIPELRGLSLDVVPDIREELANIQTPEALQNFTNTVQEAIQHIEIPQSVQDLAERLENVQSVQELQILRQQLENSGVMQAIEAAGELNELRERLQNINSLEDAQAIAEAIQRVGSIADLEALEELGAFANLDQLRDILENFPSLDGLADLVAGLGLEDIADLMELAGLDFADLLSELGIGGLLGDLFGGGGVGSVHTINAEFEEFREELIANYVNGLQLMAEQLSAVAMQSTMMIGTFLDAKNQMETQRTHQALKARAVKDYHPSEQMCRIGSYVRSLANTEAKSNHDFIVLNDIFMETKTGHLNMGSAIGGDGDFKNRIEQYKTTYCDPNDNNAGLKLLCDNGGGQVGAANQMRINKDIDYTRTVNNPYTLNLDFSTNDTADTPDEQDIVALGRNLYWDNVFNSPNPQALFANANTVTKARQIIALNNLAQNSYTKLASMKARAKKVPDDSDLTPGWEYMQTMLRDFGLSDEDILKLVGENPSYYAQMDILTKKIYQNPDFYTNLYDKPANVQRTLAALEAISLMQQRDHYEASLRREMLLSGMVEESIIPRAESLEGIILDLRKQ